MTDEISHLFNKTAPQTEPAKPKAKQRGGLIGPNSFSSLDAAIKKNVLPKLDEKLRRTPKFVIREIEKKYGGAMRKYLQGGLQIDEIVPEMIPHCPGVPEKLLWDMCRRIRRDIWQERKSKKQGLENAA